MEQPMIFLDGVVYEVASIWWSEGGEISHVTYRVAGEVNTIFSDDYPLQSLLMKRGE